MTRLKTIFRWLVRIFATAFLLQVLMAFLGLPTFVVHWFMCVPEPGTPTPPPPKYIVVLGGGGIPSASGLTRLYHAAELHKKHPGAQFVVSLPSDGDPATNSVGRMRDELVMRGVPARTIRMESAALSTHEQAVNVAKLLGPAAVTSEVRIVTSPWHLRRSLGCFRQAGFTHANVEGAASIGAEADPGGGTLLRYGIWANMTSGVECLREALALLAYKVRGWI